MQLHHQRGFCGDQANSSSSKPARVRLTCWYHLGFRQLALLFAVPSSFNIRLVVTLYHHSISIDVLLQISPINSSLPHHNICTHGITP